MGREGEKKGEFRGWGGGDIFLRKEKLSAGIIAQRGGEREGVLM